MVIWVKVPLNPVRSLRARVFATMTLWQAAILGELAVELEPAGHSQFRRPNSAYGSYSNHSF